MPKKKSEVVNSSKAAATARPRKEGAKMRVEQLMTREVKVCRVDETLNRVAQLMWECDCGCIPVIATDGDGAVVGIVTDRDVAMAAYTQGRPLWEIPVSSVLAHGAITCHATDGISRAEALMRDNQIRRLPVVDQNGNVVGILSLNDIAREAQRESANGRRAQVNPQEVSETLAAVCRPRGAREIAAA
jgi:CBS domain-containing protein